MSQEKLTDVYFTLNTGAKIPALGLGTAIYEETTSSDADSEGQKSFRHMTEKFPALEEAVYAAVKAGYRHIDTAFLYGTEPYIGNALKRLFDEKVVTREELFITTKVWPTYHDAVEESLNLSLKRLGLDYVDLLLQHLPMTLETDSEHNPILTDQGELQLAKNGDHKTFYQNLEKLYLEHPEKVKNIGVSNYMIPLLTELLSIAKVVPAVNQYEGHPELPQRELFEFNKKHGIHVTAYSPLGGPGAPLLTNEHVLDVLKKHHNYTVNEALYSYHVKSGRSVVPRSTNTKRITENVNLVPLSEEDIAELESGPVKRYSHAPSVAGDIGF